MAENVVTAEQRAEKGKGPARRLRQKGLIPAVVYGHKREPTHVAVNPGTLLKAIETPHKFNTLLTLRMEGADKYVLFKDYAVDPVSRKLLHADFLEVSLEEPVLVDVPVVTTGKAQGTTEGGILTMAAYTIAVEALANKIPVRIEVDVTDPQDRPLPPRVRAEGARGLQVQVPHRLRGGVRRGAREGGGRGCRWRRCPARLRRRALRRRPLARRLRVARLRPRRLPARAPRPRAATRGRSRRPLEARRRPGQPRRRLRADAPQRRLPRRRPAGAPARGPLLARPSSRRSSPRAGRARSGSGS